MGRMDISVRTRAISLRNLGYTTKDIQERFAEEGITVSRKSLRLLIKKFQSTGSVANKRPSTPSVLKKLEERHLVFIDKCMAEDDELTSRQLHSMFLKEFPETPVSISTVKRARQDLGWVRKKTRYCALISDKNKEKRLEWCQLQLKNGEEFNDVLFTDECTVQLESHRKVTYHKEGEKSRYKARPKHPAKINIWGGISKRGTTSIVLFSGTLTATRYREVLDAALFPFIDRVYSDSFRLMQDNDPKHTSR